LRHRAYAVLYSDYAPHLPGRCQGRHDLGLRRPPGKGNYPLQRRDLDCMRMGDFVAHPGSNALDEDIVIRGIDVVSQLALGDHPANAIIEIVGTLIYEPNYFPGEPNELVFDE
jgi:hypothetical protein